MLRENGSGTFELPFALAGNVPDSLELNAILPGGGHLEVGQVVLYELDGPVTLAGDDSDAWWSTTAAGILGAVIGSSIGMLGGLLGSLAARGAARGFVMSTLKVGSGVGVIAVAVGVVASAGGQPYHVWFLFLLFGGILAIVFTNLRRTHGARYETSELLRMRAMDSV